MMRKFTSPPQVYKARPGAGFVTALYTFPHDLGVEPHIVRMFLKCIVSDQGYPVGSIVPVGPHAADRIVVSGIPGDFVATGVTLKQTVTDVLMSFDTNHGMSIHQFNTKKHGRINNNAWEVIVKVYAP